MLTGWHRSVNWHMHSAWLMRTIRHCSYATANTGSPPLGHGAGWLNTGGGLRCHCPATAPVHTPMAVVSCLNGPVQCPGWQCGLVQFGYGSVSGYGATSVHVRPPSMAVS